MIDDADPEVESDLRRRAAWLLAMLAAAAVLFVIVISAIIRTGHHNNAGPGVLDQVATGSASHSQPTHPHQQRSSQHPTSRSAPPTTRSKPQTSSSSTPVTTSCPGAEACVLSGDVGNTVQRINDYRAQHGLPAVQGTVSPRAQTCALHNGSGCSGSWAETFLADPNGELAVHKIVPFAHLDDPRIKSVGVGWAYDPGARTYYYAVVRNG